MSIRRYGRHSLLNRVGWFITGLLLVAMLQGAVNVYQSRNVWEPLEERTNNIQAISQFLDTMESCCNVLENYRWDYSNRSQTIASFYEKRDAAEAVLSTINMEIAQVGQAQYVLANAARITFQSYKKLTDQILKLTESGKIMTASELYYSRANPCGNYVLQYSQELLEQAILDNHSGYYELMALNGTLRLIQTAAIVFCLCMGVPLVLSARQLIIAVRNMSEGARAISEGNLDTPDVADTTQDEIGDMARGFNEMKRSMKRQVLLMEEKSAMERELLRAENDALELQNLMERSKLQQLRSQVEPHFLFNTLNVIMYTAQQESAMKTHSLLGALSRTFRFSLGSNEAQVTLSKEMHVTDSVFSLYRARFGDHVRLHWEISPEIVPSETMMPSFILQPLVENAFKHGLAQKEEDGNVTIRIDTDGESLIIQVEDDGVGMSEEKLAQLREKLRQKEIPSSHIGVYNVAARLRLLGEGYGIDICSQEGKGTTAALRLRLVTTAEEEYYDEDDDC